MRVSAALNKKNKMENKHKIETVKHSLMNWLTLSRILMKKKHKFDHRMFWLAQKAKIQHSNFAKQ